MTQYDATGSAPEVPVPEDPMVPVPAARLESLASELSELLAMVVEVRAMVDEVSPMVVDALTRQAEARVAARRS